MLKSRHLVVLAFIMGILFRTIHLVWIDHDLPFYYGGLFYEFAQQIAGHNYAWPETIPYYTMGGLPFAYPPLPFYLEAFIIDLFAPSKFAVVNLLPVVLTLLSLPLFYLLCREVYDDERRQAVALLVYAALPAAFTQFIEGAGLAEATGNLAYIAFAVSLVRFYKHNRNRDAVLAGILLGISVLASPGSAYVSVPAFLIFLAAAYVSYRHAFASIILRSVLMGVIGIVIASPYLLAVSHYHGFQQFTTPVNAEHGQFIGFAIMRLLEFNVAGGSFGMLWNALILIGLIGAIVKRQWVLVAGFLLFFNTPREGDWLVTIPAVFLIVTAIESVLIPALAPLWKVYGNPKQRHRLANMAIFILSLYVFLGNILLIQRKLLSSVDEIGSDEIKALEWASQNTSPDTGLIVLGTLATLEWSPQIAERTVLNVIFGTEWKPDQTKDIEALTVDVLDCVEVDCIQQRVVDFGYRESEINIFLDKENAVLYARMLTSAAGDFDVIYDRDDILIGTLRLE